MKVNLLVFEDSKPKVESFNELLSLELETEYGITTTPIIREDDSMLESDLMMNISVILVDDDLGNDRWGDEMIDDIMEITGQDPDFKSIPIIYYSAGTDVSELRKKSNKWGGIRCCTYDDLVEVVKRIIVKQHG